MVDDLDAISFLLFLNTLPTKIMLSVKNCNLLQVMPQIKEEINDSVLVGKCTPVV